MNLLLFSALCCLLSLSGCARPELAERSVRAGSAEELAAFRAELAQDHAAPQLAAFDTALDELQLAGMDRFPTATARAAAMRDLANGKTVRAVEILGWQARRARLQGEIEQLSVTLAHDLQTRERLGAATSVTVENRIRNVEDILAKLRANLSTTEQQLAAWGTAEK